MDCITSREASQIFWLHPNTLRHYADNFTFESYRTKSGHRHYNVDAYLGLQKNLSVSAIVESVVTNKMFMLTDKSSSCKPIIPKSKLSKTLAVNSTISIKGLNPYWDAQCKEINSKLWLPTKIAWQDSSSHLFHSLSNKMVEGSWFSSKLIYPLRRGLPLTYSAFVTNSVASF